MSQDPAALMLIAPVQHLEQIEPSEANRALVSWGHKMGACNRPNGDLWAHGMFEHGVLVSVTVTSAIVAATAAGFTRQEAIELARLCATRGYLCRVMIRLWREMVFPAYGHPWAISYQDEALHAGNTYRLDGWIRLREHARSGIDQRSGRKGRVKTIWGWHSDPLVRANKRKEIDNEPK